MPSLDEALRKDHLHHWLTTEAEVTDCTYSRARFYADGAGVDEQLPHYTVGFAYAVNGTTYNGVLSSPVQVERGDKFAIRYNPDDPKENNSIESELDRPWFKEYTWLIVLVFIALFLIDFFHRHPFHR